MAYAVAAYFVYQHADAFIAAAWVAAALIGGVLAPYSSILWL